MNKNQKELLQSQLDNEKRTIRELKQVYTQALKDCEKKIAELSSRRDMENLQSIIYQKQYQEALKGQLEGVLEQLHSNEFATISDYLARCYEDGFTGVLYDLQGQGIPLIMPIDQRQVTEAIQTDSKISKSLYSRLGEDVKVLKTSIRAELSRGIANGSTWNDIAAKLANGMKNTPFMKAINNAIRIARTEGHRVQNKAAMDSQHKAKGKGADVVKQWDSTLDGRTRPSHRQCDGEFRDLDESFSNGLMYPGDPKGKAAEVVNCRCALLQRAVWNLDEKELETLKERAAYFGLDKTENFEDFKKKYLKAAEDVAKMEESGKLVFKAAKTIKEAEQFAKVIGIKIVSFKGADIVTANAMNKSLTNAMNYFSGIKDRMNFFGVTQERNRLLKADLQVYFDKWYRSNYPGQSDGWYEKYAKKSASDFVGRVGTNNAATAFSGDVPSNDKELADIFKKYSGVGVNGKVAKDSAEFIKVLEYNTEVKYHPIGCNTIESIFDHEFGHQIDYAFDIRNDDEVKKAWKEFLALGTDERKDILSEYAFKDGKIAEFIAEGYAEYLNNPKPRKYAKIIGKLIERKVKNSE